MTKTNKARTKRASVARPFSPEANLKRKLRKHLKKLGFTKDDKGELIPPASDKEAIRVMHIHQRLNRFQTQKEFFEAKFPKLSKHFANGTDIDVSSIRPRLELIDADTWQSDLFRLASLSWSVPVSAGFGRRLRYLVWDASNEKLIGLIALGDPVFNQGARDKEIGWNSDQRTSTLVDVMDAYVLGAVPPYNMLLGGKLVACLARTTNVRDDFTRRYSRSEGIISGEKKRAKLVMITTSSALGRSSVYNRLKLDGRDYFHSVGFTGGWGHFHVPDDLFAEMRKYLRKRRHGYASGHQYGDGPNWRLRTIRAAMSKIGLKADLLKHGIKREVFMCQLASNATDVLMGKRKRPSYENLLSADQVGNLAKERWLIPRADRRPEFRLWDRAALESAISISALDTKLRVITEREQNLNP